MLSEADRAKIEQRADECCTNCHMPRWRHHYFREYGTLCPSNLGVASFRSDKDQPHAKP